VCDCHCQQPLDADHNDKDHCKTENIKDALNLELVNRPRSQDSGLRHRELSLASTVSTESSIVAIDQPTQKASGATRLEARVIMHQPQAPLHRKAEEQRTYTLLQVSSFDLILRRQICSSRKREQEQ
jgi:hypothetical protein